MTEPTEYEDEVTEIIQRVTSKNEDTHEPVWQEWMNFLLG